MYTPGPWEITKNHQTRLVFVAGYPLYKASPDGSRDKQQEADARLIAAAPTMLTALENCANIISLALANGAWDHDSTDEADSIDEVSSVLNEARAASAKATGKEGLK